MKDISRNLTMLCDFYELTMSNGYFESGMKDKIVYFGPMGCRTGFYLLLFDTPDVNDAKKIVTECVEKCLLLDTIPGSKKIECGNYRSHNLKNAKEELTKYLAILKG